MLYKQLTKSDSRITNLCTAKLIRKLTLTQISFVPEFSQKIVDLTVIFQILPEN